MPIPPTRVDPPRCPPERPAAPWSTVVVFGIVAATLLGCGWGVVFYLLNK